jgi:hypothetical protein
VLVDIEVAGDNDPTPFTGEGWQPDLIWSVSREPSGQMNHFMAITLTKGIEGGREVWREAVV